MALPASGNSISMSQINTELGRSSSAQISLNLAEAGNYATINPYSSARPNGYTPNAMSEWFDYNHAATSGGGGCSEYGYSCTSDVDCCAGYSCVFNTCGYAY
jgi:hypothetical protein